ncbi:MAG TPA: biotin--[acetyl-CoA-carboxylase] ligase [Gemmatimonadales bacterium]|nr:biotin--[acetyl-CoA-carboxylase] ligase [Gemmatimonadales bacterium]
MDVLPVMRLHYYDRVSSTMDVIHQLAADGAVPGTAVMAGEQLEGRGSRGRTWHSPVGGLWLSVLFQPPVVEGIEVISLRVGLAVAEAIQARVPKPVQLKWPNDLILEGRKLGGVLCEARWQGDALGWVAVGVGMNVRNSTPAELGSVAVSLSELNPGISLEEVANPILAALRALDLGTGRLSPAELDRFARRDWLRGRTIREPAEGRVTGVGEDGALLVRTASGSDVSLRSGTVELAAASHSR